MELLTLGFRLPGNLLRAALELVKNQLHFPLSNSILIGCFHNKRKEKGEGGKTQFAGKFYESENQLT